MLPICVEAASSAIINFNLGPSPVGGTTVQPVRLYGCNNTIVNSQLFWGSQNQALSDIPYGQFKSKTGKPYVVAKYYISSPEVLNPHSEQKPAYIGLVTPDHVTFHGAKPARIVSLDYRILHSVYLRNVPVNFNYKYHGKSCAEQGVTLIPIKTQCKNFLWNDGALGASGIGQLSTHPVSTAFILTRKKNKDPLDCRVTLLDDVMLNHEVFFATKNGMVKTIDLTKLYNESKPMELICIPRKITDIPAGCRVQPDEHARD
jgi:hypothetical protein